VLGAYILPCASRRLFFTVEMRRVAVGILDIEPDFFAVLKNDEIPVGVFDELSAKISVLWLPRFMM